MFFSQSKRIRRIFWTIVLIGVFFAGYFLLGNTLQSSVIQIEDNLTDFAHALQPTLVTTTMPFTQHQIVFASLRPPKDDETFAIFELFLVNDDGTNLHQLTHSSINAYSPVWSPDGRSIVFIQGQQIYVFDLARNNKIQLTDDGDYVAPAWSPDGQRLVYGAYVDSNDADLYWMNLDGGHQHQLTSHPASDHSPSWSPDNEHIAFVTNRDGNQEIYLLELKTNELRNLSDHPANDFAPAWSPSGKQLVFVSERDGNTEIYVMDKGGTNVTRLTYNPEIDIHPAWSPHGTQIVFRSNRDLNQATDYVGGLYLLDVTTTQVDLLLSTFNPIAPSWR